MNSLNVNKVCSLLGLAMRAGKCKVGEDAVLLSVRSGHATLVVMADDTGSATRKKLTDKCTTYQVQLRMYGNRESLGSCIGKESRVSIAIEDEGFAKALLKLLDS